MPAPAVAFFEVVLAVHIMAVGGRVRRDVRLPDHLRGRRPPDPRSLPLLHRIEYSIERRLIKPGLLRRAARGHLPGEQAARVERLLRAVGTGAAVVIGAAVGAGCSSHRQTRRSSWPTRDVAASAATARSAQRRVPRAERRLAHGRSLLEPARACDDLLHGDAHRRLIAARCAASRRCPTAARLDRAARLLDTALPLVTLYFGFTRQRKRRSGLLPRRSRTSLMSPRTTRQAQTTTADDGAAGTRFSRAGGPPAAEQTAVAQRLARLHYSAQHDTPSELRDGADHAAASAAARPVVH